MMTMIYGAVACPHCGAADQRIPDRLRRSWRHLDFFQFEAWLHADVPRVACASCGKTTQAGMLTLKVVPRPSRFRVMVLCTSI